MNQPAITLHGYEKRWITNRSRFKAGMFARQTGKTFTSTLELVDDSFEAMSLEKRVRWVILSRGERQAREAMEEGVKRHCQAYNVAFDSIDGDFKGDQGTYKQLEVVLPHGTRITALPANPDTARGFSANVLLDEFAFHLDSRKIWGALFPVVSRPDLKLRVISTPNGKGNKFYEIMTGTDKVWYRQVTDIYQAVADGLPRNIEELKAALNDQDLWEQEFELKWLDEASAWLSFELINGVEDELAGIPEHYAGGPCFVGVDIAARRDLFVVWVWEQMGDVLWTREIITRRRASFAEQDAIKDDVFRRYRVVRMCEDQTGMGEKPVEDDKNRFGSERVEGVLFTASNKQILATRGKEAFEDKKVRIPAGSNELRSDLHKLKKVQSETGAPRFVADSDSAGHADRAWAAFLGINAAAGPREAFGYEAVPARGGDDSNRVIRVTGNFKGIGGAL